MLVGEEKQKFIVHRDMICKTSNFFKTAVAKDWKEANECEVHLPEQQPIAFQTYLESIYNPNVDVCAMAEAHIDDLLQLEEGSETLTSRQMYGLSVLKLSVLGDYIRDTHFKNVVMRG